MREITELTVPLTLEMSAPNSFSTFNDEPVVGLTEDFSFLSEGDGVALG